MKLGILVTIISGFGKKGYYNSQEVGLAKKLASFGNIVKIYKCVDKNSTELEENIDENITIKYIPCKSIGVHGYLDVKNIDVNLDGLLAFSDTQIFIKHIYSYCIKHKIAFIPYVGIAHSFQKNTKSFFMDLLFKVSTLQIYRKTDVLCKNYDAQTELHSLGVTSTKVVPVGLDFSIMKSDYEVYDRQALRKEYGFDNEDCIISFIARLKKEKRPEELIEIFNKVKTYKRFKLIIVGEGPERKRIDDLIKQYGIGDRVKIIDRISNSEIWKIHYISDYFINLRKEEIFGMAILEAVYYKSSVIAINAPGPSIILENMGGHYLCDNTEDVEGCLRMNYPSLALLEDSRKKLINDFSWDSVANAFISLTELKSDEAYN